MDQGLDAMRAALRVLTALNEKRRPPDSDILELRQFAGPQPADMDLDELACTVIQKVLQSCAGSRARGKRGT
jgi:hypothetical protein